MLACPNRPKRELALFADLRRSTRKPSRRLAISLSVSLATFLRTKTFPSVILKSFPARTHAHDPSLGIASRHRSPPFLLESLHRNTSLALLPGQGSLAGRRDGVSLL